MKEIENSLENIDQEAWNRLIENDPDCFVTEDFESCPNCGSELINYDEYGEKFHCCNCLMVFSWSYINDVIFNLPTENETL